MKITQILLRITAYIFLCPRNRSSPRRRTWSRVHPRAGQLHRLVTWGVNLACPFSSLFRGVLQSLNSSPESSSPLTVGLQFLLTSVDYVPAVLTLLCLLTPFHQAFASLSHAGDLEQLMASIKSSRNSLILFIYRARPSAWLVKLSVVPFSLGIVQKGHCVSISAPSH